MTDRDTFAAAALTGLLAAPTDKDRSSEYWARFSYEIADAMLRVKGNQREMDYPQPTLTDEEREALEWLAYHRHGIAQEQVVVLRGLLARSA